MDGDLDVVDDEDASLVGVKLDPSVGVDGGVLGPGDVEEAAPLLLPRDGAPRHDLRVSAGGHERVESVRERQARDPLRVRAQFSPNFVRTDVVDVDGGIFHSHRHDVVVLWVERQARCRRRWSHKRRHRLKNNVIS